MADAALSNDIHRLVDTAVPPAPWLEGRVMSALMESAAGPSQRKPRPLSLTFLLPAIAAALIATIGVGVLIGSRLAPAQHSVSQVGRSSDARLVAYRAMLLFDLDQKIVNAKRGTYWCVSREQCILRATSTKAQIQNLILDMAGTPPPPQVAAAASQVVTAAEELVWQSDAAIVAMQAPDSDYQSIYDSVDLTHLKLAIGVIDCWPAPAVIDGSWLYGYRCASVAG